MIRPWIGVALQANIALAVFALCACENANFGAREAGALTGAALGAGLGAIVGNSAGNTGAGIAIGSGFGAISGALIGNEVDNTNAALDEREKQLQDQERQLEENRRLLAELRNAGADARTTDRGVVVNMPDVLFEFNSARLTSSAQRTAGDIAKVVRESGSNRHISVEGHTDSIGSIAYNQRLSEARAHSVASELAAEGIPRNQMKVRGYGETQPIASNSTDAGRQRNRRVEVIIENSHQ